MAYDQSKDHKVKSEVRKNLFAGIKGPLKKYFTLPAEKCEDIVLALKLKVLDKDTIIVFGEKNREISDKIKRKLYELGFKKVTALTGDIRDKNNLEKIILSHEECPFDFMFFDFCGPIEHKCWNFFVFLNEIISTTNCAFTFDAQIRNCNVFRETYPWINGGYSAQRMKDFNSWVDNSYGIELSNSSPTITNKDSIKKAIWTLNIFFAGIHASPFQRYYSPSFQRIPKGFNFKDHIDNVVCYKEPGPSHSMLFFRSIKSAKKRA